MIASLDRLGAVTVRVLIRALREDGFIAVRQRGSHIRFVHPDGRATTVAFHRGSDIVAKGTLKAIIERDCRWNDLNLKRVGLLKK